MNSKVLGVILLVLAIWGGWKFYEYVQTFQKPDPASSQTAQADVSSVPMEQLGALPPKMEESLAIASKSNPASFKKWLEAFDKNPVLKDPRKAWIQLDYVVMVSTHDAAEARRVFKEVKARVAPDSPVYERVKKLEKTYE